MIYKDVYNLWRAVHKIFQNSKKKKKKSFPHIFHLKTKTNTQHTNREQNFSMEGE